MLSNAVKSEISNMSSDDLNALVPLIKNRRQVLTLTAAAKLEVGQPVYFAGKYGATVRGHITAIKRGGKLLVRATDGLTWRVPAGHVKTA